MSSIGNALGIALQSLNAINKQIQVTSDNIANANNDEYNQRDVGLSSVQTGGVFVSGSTRAVNSGLRRAELNAKSEQDLQKTRNQIYQEIENFLGTNFDTTILSNVLQDFENAWRDFQATPELAGVEKNIINIADDFIQELSRLNENLLDLEVNISRQIDESVNDLNTTLNDIHRINSNIAFNQHNPELLSHYSNQLEPLITKLAGYVDISTTQSTDGRTYIFTDSTSLITSTPVQFSYNHSDGSLIRSDINNLPTDFSRDFAGGSLEALIKLNSNRPDEISSPDYSVAVVNKLRNQLDNIAYLFYHEGVAVSNFSNNVQPNTAGNIVYENSGVQVGTLSIEVFDNTGARIGSVDTNVTDATTYDDLIAQFNTLSASTNTLLDYDVTDGGQFVVKGIDDGAGADDFADGYQIRIQDTTGIFYTDGVGHVFNRESPPPFAHSYNSATTNNVTRTELASGFFEKVVAANPFGVNNIQVNEQLTQRLDPPNLKRAAANGVVDAFVASARSINNSGLNGDNYTYREISIGFINNILAESRTITESASRTEQIYEQTHIDLRNDVGVSLDVELARLTVLQNSYSATARVISVTDQLLSELINLAR